MDSTPALTNSPLRSRLMIQGNTSQEQNAAIRFATTEPTNDEVRLAADVVMGRLVAVVAELRGEPAPDPHGVSW